jgi:hypothetical protein
MSSASQAQKDVDGASVFSTSTFSSTVSLLKSVRGKLHRGEGKLSKEQKKELAEEKRKEKMADGPVQWQSDINGDSKTGKFLFLFARNNNSTSGDECTNSL